MLSPFWLFSQVREGWHRGLRQDALGCQGQGSVTAETWDTRPGKHSQFANLKMAIEIVDLPMKNCDLP